MYKFKILITSKMFGKLDPEPGEMLIKEGFEIVDNPYRGKVINEDILIDLLKDVDAAIVGDDPFSRRVLETTSKLKVIAKFGVGVDKIDIEAATQKKIAVTNAPSTNKDAVADLAFALMLSAGRQVVNGHNVIQSGNWKPIVGTEMWNKTIGILGLGEIGKAVALRAKGFNMKIMAFDTYPDEKFIKENDIILSTKESIYKEADFITLHIPATKETAKMIGEKELAMMKKSTFIVNTARGAIIDEEALYHALKNDVIAGAALDVFKSEPPTGSPLLELPNIITTPHMGAFTKEAIDNAGIISSKNVIAVLKKGIPVSILNPKVLKEQS